jgi:hypothetical protein
LRDGWAAKSGASDHGITPTEAAEAPANLMNWRRLSDLRGALLADFFSLVDIPIPFRASDLSDALI